MKKSFLKIAAVAAVLVSGVVATAPKAEARIFPGTTQYPCVDGYYDVVHFGWFGSIKSMESGTC